ncbi:MAG: hypothetical protein ACLFQY_19460 [Desulfococcaceae bacterium]
MKPHNNPLDLSALPPHAKGELLEFYEFLCKKSGTNDLEAASKSDRKGKRFSMFLANTIDVQKTKPIQPE